LVRRLESVKDQPGYGTDLVMMHKLMKRGPHNTDEGMRLGSLKAKYRE
jgi:hypothetical protein